MKVEQFSSEEIKERNQFLYEHIMQLSKSEAWEKNLALAKESIRIFKNEEWLSDIKTVYVIGHGTSLATCMNTSCWISHFAGVLSTAVPAFQFKSYSQDYLKKNTDSMLVIGISCGGNTASVAEGLTLARASGAKTLAISGQGENLAIVDESEYRIAVDTRCEKNGRYPAPAYSISHIFLLLAGYSLAMLLGRRNGNLDEISFQKCQDMLDQTIAIMECLPMLYDKTADVVDDLLANGMINIAVLGTGPNIGTMQEGALKISEFSWIFGAGEELEDFAHGRFREVGEHEALLILAPDGPAVSKTMDILAGSQISKTPTVVFTDVPNPAMKKMATYIVEMPHLPDEYVSPFLYVFLMWFFGHRIRSQAGGLVGQARYGLLATDINFTAHFDENGERKKS